MHADVQASFRNAFGYAAEGVWMAPGRVNLIGEHTDYNDGFVLPIALPYAITAAAARRTDGVLRFQSRQAEQAVEVPLDALGPGSVSGWAAYPAGVIWALRAHGHIMSGLDVLIDGAVPLGAGLSSSAALGCVTALAAAQLHGLDIDRPTLAFLVQRAENAFAGMPCGIMDQAAALLCTAGHALFLDTRTLDAEQVPLDLAAHGLALLIIDTQAPHRFVDGEYAARRRTCERAASLLDVKALRDIEIGQLPTALTALPDDDTRRRVRHVVTENARVLEVVKLLQTGRLPDIGPILTASHASLREDYEVTVAELDTAVDTALATGVLGARMTGGGFGGCVIALLAEDQVNTCASAVSNAFRDRGFAEPAYYVSTPSAGARQLP
jgi:galactokinase